MSNSYYYLHMAVVLIIFTLSRPGNRSMMALTRGVNASYPCPICLVPKEEIPHLSISHQLRTAKNMQAIWNEASELNATDKEKLLKSFGLRDVEVTFVSVQCV